MNHRLESMTSDELGSTPATILLVPLGATEQHGPHLPLGTDSDIATAWANATAAALVHAGVEAVVAPTLPFGSSGEHQMFPGTLSIGQEVLAGLVVELARSAAGDHRTVAFLSGHAGNLEPVTAAVEQLLFEGHDARHFFPTWPPADGRPLDAHAGRTETSIMLDLDPDSVRLDRLAPGATEALSELMPRLLAGGVAAVSDNGVLGDPTGATRAEGRELMAALVQRTVTALLKA